MIQGDLSVENYGKKMKKAAYALRDVGMPVDAPTLLLNLLRGVNRATTPPPTSLPALPT
jgi:hypothetical protein